MLVMKKVSSDNFTLVGRVLVGEFGKTKCVTLLLSSQHKALRHPSS
jgi:hypothetical protein